LEAMAARLPVVTTDFSGVNELIHNGHNGIIVPLNDAESAAEALRFYLNNPEKMKAYGDAAFRSVESAFSMGEMVNNTEKLYRKMLEDVI